MNLHPIRGHLWYLSAILTCYAMFWIYIKLNKKDEQLITYQPLYICGFLLLMMHIMWSLKATGINMKISYQMYRNGLFFGFPMFCLGLYIRENYNRIKESFALSEIKDLSIFIIGTAIGVFQFIYIGKVEMPIGTIFAVCSLLLFSAERGEKEKSNLRLNTIAKIIGNASIVVYIIHMLCSSIINFLSKDSAFWIVVVKNKYMYPLTVVFISLVIGLLISYIQISIKTVRSKKL